MEPLLMPPVSQRCPSFYIESMLPSFSHHMLLWSCLKEVETWVGHSSVILTLHVGHSWYSYWFVHLWSSPSTLYSFAEYLMLDYGGRLNALLPADFIPSTSDHLFWDWNLESFWVPWDLQSSVAGSLAINSLWEYINFPWFLDPLKCLTSTHLFTLVSLHSSTLIHIFIIGGWSHVC